MDSFIIIFLFVLGLCFGSFLNVLIYRLPRGLPITGRSFCPKCKKKIAWYDNIPLFSFILLKGRCRFCYFPISWQYPFVELTTAIFTILVVYHTLTYDTRVTIYLLLIVYALIVIFVSDLRYQIIPDQIIYPAILISLIYNFLLSSTWKESIRPPSRCLLVCLPPSEVFWGALISGFSAAGFFFLLHLLTRGRGMGLGDVKLTALMGLFLGFPKIIVALYLAFLTGALAGVILMISGKKKLGSHIPFGPFLAGVTIVSLFYGEVIWQKLIAVLL